MHLCWPAGTLDLRGFPPSGQVTVISVAIHEDLGILGKLIQHDYPVLGLDLEDHGAHATTRPSSTIPAATHQPRGPVRSASQPPLTRPGGLAESTPG